jgi:hypothetical protein
VKASGLFSFTRKVIDYGISVPFDHEAVQISTEFVRSLL